MKKKPFSLVFLICILLFSLLIPVFGTEYLNDGFEGDSDYIPPWTGTDTDGNPGSTVAFNSTVKHCGSNSSRSHIDSDSGSRWSYCYYDMGNPTERYFRAYIQWDSFATVSRDSNSMMMGIGFRYDTVTGYGWGGRLLLDACDDSGTFWKIKYWNDTANYNLYVNDTIHTDEWYSIELYYQKHDSTGGAQIWINGSSIWSISGHDTDAQDLKYACLGIHSSAWNEGHFTFSDCAIIADTYIGEEEIGQDLTFNFSESCAISDNLELQKEKRLIFAESLIVVSELFFSKELAITFFEFLEVCNITDLFNIGKEKLIILEDPLSISSEMFMSKEQKLTFIEFLETVIIDSELYFVSSIIEDIGELAFMLALVALVIALFAFMFAISKM